MFSVSNLWWTSWSLIRKGALWKLLSVPTFICGIIITSLKVVCRQFDVDLALASSRIDRRLMGPRPCMSVTHHWTLQVTRSQINPVSHGRHLLDNGSSYSVGSFPLLSACLSAHILHHLSCYPSCSQIFLNLLGSSFTGFSFFFWSFFFCYFFSKAPIPPHSHPLVCACHYEFLSPNHRLLTRGESY